jgi:membrane protein DedA with SNARE-associated domain
VHQFFREYLEAYGYLFLFIGTFLEGEAVLILAGYFAFQGTLSLPGVIITALAGSFLGDQFYFFLGRWKGKWLLGLFASLAKKFRRAGRRCSFLIRFLILNLLSATSWAILFSLAGFFFGKSASYFIEDLDQYEPYIVLVLFLIIGCFWFAHFIHVWWLGRHARTRLQRKRVWQASRDECLKNNESKENTRE